MKAKQISNNIYWVGGIDWNLRNFHGYLTQKGSTYNAYLIIDEKVTLIDTVKSHLTDEMLERISDVIDPAKIDYIVSNHVEMDHSGAIPKILELAPNATVITSPNGEKGLKEHYKANWKFHVIKDNEVINLGKNNLQFVLTPMVHWPDNMVCYLPEEKILFSNDAFGQHLATDERFDDEYYLDIILEEARKYYANIVLPYGTQVKKALEALKGIDINIIAPSHGIVWRNHIESIMQEYIKWSDNQFSNKALIIYDTMWESTHKIAKAIQTAFENKNYVTRILSLQHNHISDIMTEVIDAEYICVGSPTLNNNMLPTVSAFLTYLNGLSPKNRKGLAFGSFGWGGQSISQVAELLSNMKYEMLAPVKVKYIPDAENLKAITQQIESAL